MTCVHGWSDCSACNRDSRTSAPIGKHVDTNLGPIRYADGERRRAVRYIAGRAGDVGELRELCAYIGIEPAEGKQPA